MKKILLQFLLLFTTTLFAQEFPPRPEPPRLVNDLAGLLNQDEASKLEQKLVAFNDSNSSQIAIVTITSLGGYNAADYSFRLAERWGIGQKGKNNGILILVAKESRDVFIATGYGMEEFVPDAISKRITENEIIPHFKNGEFYKGLDEGTDKIIGLVSGEFKAEDIKPAKRSSEGMPFPFIIMLVIFIIIFLFKGGRGGGTGHGPRTFMSPRHTGGWGSFTSGGGSFGGGGGFGGFGGGSFGGGGAGGKW